MRKAKAQNDEPAGMLPEYDFKGKVGVRGKYYEAYRQGHQVRVYSGEGKVIVSPPRKSGCCLDH